MAPKNLGDLIDRNADPDMITIIDLSDNANPLHVTYGELSQRIDAVARSILARGYERGDTMAILAANSTDYLCAYYGIMRAGLIAVPLNYKFPAETIHYMLADCNARLVFADAERAALCPAGIPIVRFDDDGDQGFDALLDPGPFDCVGTNHDDVGMILYTSGSTGRPKGVPLTHSGQLWVLNNIAGDGSTLRRHRFLVAAPLYHMNGLLMSKIVAACHASEVLLPQFRAAQYIEAIEQYRCTYLTSVPTMIALAAKETAMLAKTDLSSVENVMMGSAPLTQPLIDQVRGIFPETAVYNAYGTTEAGAGTFGGHPDGHAKPDIALGYPAPGVEARLIAGDNQDADEGVLQLRTPAQMPGYLNLPERTAQCVSAEGWYDTGDIMRRDADGFYYFVGRADDMFVCGGENIFPGEVEKMLERHPAIHQACVVPAEDSVRGQKPVAYIVGAPGTKITEAEVKAFALENGPPQQHPRNVEFVDALPLAGTNKIDRRVLIERAIVYSEVPP
jgi:acyl-CoA synthetase (AMP-forming)/AMP-acid ligase II